jgi:hypothetical protein
MIHSQLVRIWEQKKYFYGLFYLNFTIFPIGTGRQNSVFHRGRNYLFTAIFIFLSDLYIFIFSPDYKNCMFTMENLSKTEV